MRARTLFIIGTLLLSSGCLRTSRRRHASTAGTSSGAAVDATPQTPEQLDARYRELARHLARAPVWDSSLRALSAQGLETLRQYSQGRSNPESYETLEVVSSDWALMRHNVTGIVTGRSVAAITVARFPDGHCMLYGTSLRQDYVGGEFAETLRTNGTGGGVGVSCATIEAITAARSDIAR